jgi:hypothetical protein
LWPADRHWYCPKCEGKVVGDPEPKTAKFAPGRSGTRVPNLGTELPETGAEKE